MPIFERFQPGSRFTGQNLVWVACIRIRHGILQRDPALAAEGFAWIGREVAVTPRAEGIQPDFSFFQHGLLLYSGGYGAGFICDVANFLALASGTAYAWPQVKADLLASLILDGTRWMVRGRSFDCGAIGREITRTGHDAARFFHACESMASISGPRQAEFQAVIDAGRSGSHVTGNRYFWCADLMTHHRPGGYASVRLASSRVFSADQPCCGGEGRLGHHMAEGATFFMKDGDEYRDIFAVWNWQQIPGTTAEQLARGMDPEGLRRLGEKDFASGVSDGQVGLAAMDFSRDALAARKAYFCYDGALLCLGTAITCSSPATVRTTIDQCHLQGAVRATDGDGTRALGAGVHVLAAGTRIDHHGVTYHLISGDGCLTTESQSGAWSDCGVGSDEVIALPVFNLGIDHGCGMRGGEYAYRVQFEGDRGQLEGDSDAGAPAVIENTASRQAAWSADERVGMVVFYEAGRVSFPEGLTVAVDRPCALILRQREDGELVITASDPAQGCGVLRLRLEGRLTLEVGLTLPDGNAAGSSTTLLLRSVT